MAEVQAKDVRPNTAWPPPQRDFVADAGKFVGRMSANAGRWTMGVAKGTAVAAKNKTVAGFESTTSAITQWVRNIHFGAVLAWLIQLLAAPILFINYSVISSHGLRTQYDLLATPLYRCVPWLHSLGQWKETRRLDIAFVMSMAIMAASWVAWSKLIRLYIFPSDVCSNAEKVWWTVSLTLLVTDGFVFWHGIVGGASAWETGNAAGLFAVVLTAIYLSVLVLVALVTESLKHRKGA